MLIVGDRSTYGQEDLLAHSLAFLDIWSYQCAIVQQLARSSVWVLIVRVTALVAEIRARVAAGLVRELVDESNGDDVDVAVSTEVSETLLVWSLALMPVRQQGISYRKGNGRTQ